MNTVSTSLLNKIVASSIVLTYCVHAAGFVDSALAAPTVAKKTTSAKSSSSFNLDEPWSVLKNPKVLEAMKSAMGSSYPLFEQSTQQLESFEIKGDDMIAQGGIAGLYTIQESAVSFNKKTNRAQVAILDNDKLNIWGASSQTDLSPTMTSFIADLQSRRSKNSQDKMMKSIFQSPGNSTIKLAKSESPKSNIENIKTLSPTGTYSRDKKWQEATLKILKLKGNKIKFEISAANGANTDGASGEIDLVNNKGTYKGEGYKLTFDYRGKTVAVTASNPGVGGSATVAGTYSKTDSKAPTFDNIY